MFDTIVTHDMKRTLRQRADARRVCGPYQWSPAESGNGRGFYSSQRDALVMDSAGSPLSLRLEEANDHLRGSRLAFITGYHTDPDGDGDTLRPVIARLPRGRGFLAGWTMGAGMCGSLDATIWSDAEEAARAAHDMAARDGEAEAQAEWERRKAEDAEHDDAED